MTCESPMGYLVRQHRSSAFDAIDFATLYSVHHMTYDHHHYFIDLLLQLTFHVMQNVCHNMLI